MNLDNLNTMVNDAIKRGADYCDLYLQSSIAHSVRYEDKKMSALSSVCTEGTGARIVSSGRTFYAHRPRAFFSNVSTALNSALDMGGFPILKNLQNGDNIFDEKSFARTETEFMHDIDAELRRRSNCVKQISMRFSQADKDILLFAPDGLRKHCNKKYTTFLIEIVAERNGQLQTAMERRYMALSADKFWGSVTAMDMADTAFNRVMLMLEAKPCPAGVMNVYLAGDAGGTIIHEACGHGLEADIVEKDASVFKGKIGQKVASEFVTMVDDPTIKGLYGSYEFDDEGTAASRTVLIQNGILKNYMTDKFSAMLYNIPETGNGRRQSYRSVPIPRMSNTFLMPGKGKTEEEMLERVKDGLYVKKMGGGEVNPTTGDFVFYVSEAYIIRNGKKCEPVKGATLAGNGPQVLQNVIEIGDNLVMDPGVCGKAGQNVPVTDGQPSMVVERMTVGGKDV